MDAQGGAALIIALTSFVTGTSASIVAIIKAAHSDGKANDLAEDMQTVAKAVPAVHEDELNSKEIVDGHIQ